MPGATQQEKSATIGRRLSDNLQASREKATRETLTSILRGKKLQREANQSDRDDSGGGYYSERSESIYLFVDHTFRHEIRSFSSVSGGGLSLPSERKSVSSGTWAVEMVAGDAHLVLRTDEAIVESWKTRDGGVGVQYLNGARWNRYTL